MDIWTRSLLFLFSFPCLRTEYHQSVAVIPQSSLHISLGIWLLLLPEGIITMTVNSNWVRMLSKNYLKLVSSWTIKLWKENMQVMSNGLDFDLWRCEQQVMILWKQKKHKCIFDWKIMFEWVGKVSYYLCPFCFCVCMWSWNFSWETKAWVE